MLKDYAQKGLVITLKSEDVSSDVSWQREIMLQKYEKKQNFFLVFQRIHPV